MKKRGGGTFVLLPLKYKIARKPSTVHKVAPLEARMLYDESFTTYRECMEDALGADKLPDVATFEEVHAQMREVRRVGAGADAYAPAELSLPVCSPPLSADCHRGVLCDPPGHCA